MWAALSATDCEDMITLKAILDAHHQLPAVPAVSAAHRGGLAAAVGACTWQVLGCHLPPGNSRGHCCSHGGMAAAMQRLGELFNNIGCGSSTVVLSKMTVTQTRPCAARPTQQSVRARLTLSFPSSACLGTCSLWNTVLGSSRTIAKSRTLFSVVLAIASAIEHPICRWWAGCCCTLLFGGGAFVLALGMQPAAPNGLHQLS